MSAPVNQARAPTAEDVFRLAADFEHSALLVSRGAGNCGAIVRVSGFAPMPGLIPEIVNLSFSIELYLKSLLWLETGTEPPRGHSLERLFGLVTPARQARIVHHYDAFIGSHRTIIEAKRPAKLAAGLTGFHSSLKATSDAFVTWRYAYERKMADGAVMTTFFPRAVRRTILEVRPDFTTFLSGLSLMGE